MSLHTNVLLNRDEFLNWNREKEECALDAVSICFCWVIFERMVQIRSQATRLHEYVILPPPTLLESALLRLLWQSAGVSVRGERSCVCLPELWEERLRGDGCCESGPVVMLWGAAEHLQELCSALPLQRVCADTTLHCVGL